MMTNPLLAFTDLPPFTAIKAEYIVPAVNTLLQENRDKTNELIALAQITPPSCAEWIMGLETLEDRLGRVWSPINHLHAVKNSAPLREAYQTCLPLLSDYQTELSQDARLYAVWASLAQTANFAQLTATQQKIVTDALLDCKLSGVALPPAEKARYKELHNQLTLLTSKFEENVLDATQGWHCHITDEAVLAGLPSHALNEAAQQAALRQKTGWVFTLDFPSYFAVMSFADDRALRETLYTGYVTRASDQGPQAGQWDNSQVMANIVATRQAIAQLLGFEHYAQLALADRMAQSPQQVVQFLTDLAQRARPRAEQEFAELTEFAHSQYGITSLAAWDIAYYSEKLRQQRYQVSDEDVRPYFPIDRVLTGLFALVNKLFGIVVTATSGVATWHDTVRFFTVTDPNGELCGQFYVDLYTRADKRGGAWMDECRLRRRLADGTLQTPVAYLTCNFSPPQGDQPALLTHEEVLTLFHEFGHVLHHILTKIDYASVAGIQSVPWDAVEFPSQFFEHWAWQPEVLAMISQHYLTQEALPTALQQKMIAAKNFQSALQMLRQLEFALFDFRLHQEPNLTQPEHIANLLHNVRQQISVVPVPSFNCFQHSFTHIFSGGYAAGYYSYKWSEVLASDAFARFEEEGLFDPKIGQQFLAHILQQGGSQPAMALFVAFRGREPKIDALLRHCGL